MSSPLFSCLFMSFSCFPALAMLFWSSFSSFPSFFLFPHCLFPSPLLLPFATSDAGATAAVGLCTGDVRGINWKLLGWCFFSWILTVPLCACISGLMFSLLIYSPAKGYMTEATHPV